jgi:hypothetical protein
MRHITMQHVADVLNRMNTVFDAHAAEKRGIGMFPRKVGGEIASHTNSPTMSALQKFSMQYALFIDRVFGSRAPHPQIRKTTSGPRGDGKVMSENLAGDLIENQEWEKLGTGPIAAPARTADLDALIAELDREAEEADEEGP